MSALVPPSYTVPIADVSNGCWKEIQVKSEREHRVSCTQRHIPLWPSAVCRTNLLQLDTAVAQKAVKKQPQ